MSGARLIRRPYTPTGDENNKVAVLHRGNTLNSDIPPPQIPRDLLEYLAKTFPNRLPPGGTAHDEIERLIGEQRVMAHLEEVYRQQQEKDELPNVLLETHTTRSADPGSSSAASR